MLRGTEMQLIERIYAALMRGIMQVGQTHCVYVIEQKDFDAFTPQRRATSQEPERT
jgi:hypothetical protein